MAIDTCTSSFSLALCAGQQLVELFTSSDTNKQAEMLVPEIEALLARHQLRYEDLQFLAVNVGPGSFTGLRIGLSVVKALLLVLPAQAIAVTSLEAAALAKGGGELPKDVVLDARRGQAFCQSFAENLQPLSEAVLRDYSGEFDAPANAQFVAQVALHKLANAANFGEISPLYIREADAKLPSK